MDIINHASFLNITDNIDLEPKYLRKTMFQQVETAFKQGIFHH